MMPDRTPTDGSALTTDLSSDDAIPYFLWDHPMTVREVRARLEGTQEEQRLQMLGKILREARMRDVWLFTRPREIAVNWRDLERYLGRRRDFWQFLLDQWRKQGLLD
jgi:hypothetical protein